jgi:hypothetical protein
MLAALERGAPLGLDATTTAVSRPKRSSVYSGFESLRQAADAQSVGRMLVVLLQGIAAGARAGRSKAQLEAALDTALELVAPRRPPRNGPPPIGR